LKVRYIARTMGLAGLLACSSAPPEADAGFTDALRWLFANQGDAGADLGAGLRELEAQTYSDMDLSASNVNDRALRPGRLRASDVRGLERPERPLGAALPVAVAGLSDFDLDAHARLQLLADQRPVEPYSPDKFDRTFQEGADCWASRGCDALRTTNDLIKKNLLMEVPYWFYKDFRWVDLAEDGPARWGFLARSWTTEVFSGDKENAWIQQSYTVEVWIPRDGRGYRDEGAPADSAGGGALRLLALWSETTFDGLQVSDDLVIKTTRGGIDSNFRAVEDYLAESGAP
jgi:hypothetical protein